MVLECGAAGDGALANGRQRRAESGAGPSEIIQANCLGEVTVNLATMEKTDAGHTLAEDMKAQSKVADANAIRRRAIPQPF